MGTPKFLVDAIFESVDSSIIAHLLEDRPNASVDSMLILNIALETGLIDGSMLEQIKTAKSMEAKLQAFKSVEPEELLKNLEDYLPYKFQLHRLEGDVLVCTTPDESEESRNEDEQVIVKILDLQNGMACTLITKEQLCDWAKAKLESKLDFTDSSCKKKDEEADYLQLPFFLETFVRNQLPVYIESALQCLQMVENREYAVKDGQIIPVDFQNSGIMETNKRWGGGLQQMLEMKHKVRISPLSVVTNFMSHIELFSRYRHKGSIFGLTGTLALDSLTTKTLLYDLFNVKVCSVPTHRRRKLFERPETVVHGDTSQWFEEIVNVINIAVKPILPFKHGRAVLILCEDIKTAHEFRKYMLEKENWNSSKVKVYAHSNSDEVKTIIDQTFVPGEIVIATNLAGRGTDIKVTEEVNRSGGLLCILTFLPRNRRVELQAFGRTARKGEPGSVQCILKSSSLPSHYYNLSLEDIRNLRDQEEQLRLDQLVQSDIKEVHLREILFKMHCKFIEKIHNQIRDRDDKVVVIDSLNESWGQWLQMKKKSIENLEESFLIKELKTFQNRWRPIFPDDPTQCVDVPVANFYHMIKFGNSLLASQEEENVERAAKCYSKSIKAMPRYALIAHYYRAYCTILMEKGDYVKQALNDLNEAEKCIDLYVTEVVTIMQCVAITSQLRRPTSTTDCEDKPSDTSPKSLEHKNEDDNFSLQMQVRMQILDNIRRNIREACQVLEVCKKRGDGAGVKACGVFSLLPGSDLTTNIELCAIWNLGMEVVYAVERKPRFCWEGLVVFLLGCVEIFVGALLSVFTVGTAASIGMYLISEGISDCIDGVVAMVKGEFSWAEWGISKATNLAITLVTGGLASFASKGRQSLNIGAKLSKVGKELKAIPSIAKASWGIALKENVKNVAKYVVKEVVQEAIMRGVSYAEDKAFERIADEIAEKCGEKIQEKLLLSFTNGQLGRIAEKEFLSKVQGSCSPSDRRYKEVEEEAYNFFGEVGEHTLNLLVSRSEIRERLTSASLNFLSQMSKKTKPKSGKMYFIAAEVGVMATCVAKTVDDIQILIDAFTPEFERKCKEVLQISEDLSHGLHMVDDHKCASTLKEGLSAHMRRVFDKAVASVLQGNLGCVVSHGLNRTVNHLGKKILSNKVKFLRNNKTLEKIKAGQHANYVRSVDLFSGKLTQSNREMVDSYVKNVAELNHPGSLLELRAVVEHFGQGVTIYQEVNGKMKKYCTVDPTASTSTRHTTPNIELVFIPPANKRSKTPGHYEVLINGRKTEINSRANNCLFHAFSCGMHPDSSPEVQHRFASELRAQVASNIRDEPHLWQKHISHRMKMDELHKGNYYALVGAGPAKKKNVMSKIILRTYEEKIDPEDETQCTLIKSYKQANGIACVERKRFDKPVTLETDENGRQYIASDDLTLVHLTVEMKGLNLKKNKAMRCWDTQPVSGMIKRHLKHVKKGNKSKDSPVSFHLCPSEAGACAGKAYANAVMTSPDYNKQERAIWTPELREKLGGDDFGMRVEVNAGPLVPKDIGQFVANANEYRLANGRDEIHRTNAASLLERFKMIEKIEPRAYRVESIKGSIFKDGAGQLHDFSMPKDYDLYVPTQYSEANQPKQYEKELSKAERKINRQRLNCPPKYRKPPRDTR